MMQVNRTAQSRVILFLVCLAIGAALMTQNAAAQTGAWLTHSHDEQHTALSTVQSQPLSKIHWHMPVDLAPPQGEILIHYGSPLITAANTVIVPVKTGSDSSSRSPQRRHWQSSVDTSDKIYSSELQFLPPSGTHHFRQPAFRP